MISSVQNKPKHFCSFVVQKLETETKVAKPGYWIWHFTHRPNLFKHWSVKWKVNMKISNMIQGPLLGFFIWHASKFVYFVFVFLYLRKYPYLKLGCLFVLFVCLLVTLRSFKVVKDSPIVFLVPLESSWRGGVYKLCFMAL